MPHRGADGEAIAARFLRRSGFRILARNVRTRGGEIDIVAETGHTLCFVEVRARTRDAFGTPSETVTQAKQKRLIRAASAYLQSIPRGNERFCRFDVVAVGPGGVVEHLVNAFQA